MKTSTAAWIAALAVMSMRGPFTTAEAAPAQQEYHERPRHFIPKNQKRGYNDTITVSSKPPSMTPDESSALPTDESSAPPTSDSSPPKPSSKHRPSRKRPHHDHQSAVESLVSPGVGPGTETQTVTHTETSTPASESSIPLTSSISVPASSSDDGLLNGLPKHGPLSPQPSSSQPSEEEQPHHDKPNSYSHSPFGSNSTFSYPHPTAAPPSSSQLPSSSSEVLESSSELPASSSEVTSSSAGAESGIPFVGSISDILPHARPTGHRQRPSHDTESAASDSEHASSSHPVGSSGGLLPDVLPQPTHHSDSDSSSAIVSSSQPVGSGGGFLPNVLPTPKHSDEGDHPHVGRPTGNRPNPLGTHGIVPLTDPKPTPPPHAHHGTDLAPDSSSSSGLLVGINTILSNGGSNLLPPSSDLAGLVPTDGTKTGKLTDGLTGLGTGVPNVAPTDGPKPPKVTDGLTGLGTGLPNVVPTPDATDGSPPNPLSGLTDGPLGTGRKGTGKGHKSDGLVPLPTPSNLPDGLSGVGTGVAGLTSKLTSDLGGVGTGVAGLTSKVPGLTGGLPTGTGALPTDVTPTLPTGPKDTLLSHITGDIPTGLTGGLPNGITNGIPTGVVPTGVVPGTDDGSTKTGDVGGILSSAQSEVSSALSGVTKATGGTGVPVVPTVHPLASIQSSLDSKLSGIAATATDPAVVTSVQSGLSSILTSAASDLGTDVPKATNTIATIANTPAGTNAVPIPTPTVPNTGDATNNIPAPTPPSSVAYTVTGGGTSVVVTVPTPGTVGGLTGITVPGPSEGATGATDATTAPPAPSDTYNEPSDSSEPTPSDAYPDSSDAPASESTIASSIPLTTGATVPVGPSSSAAPTESATPDVPSSTEPAAATPADSDEPTKSTPAPHTIKPTGSDTYTSMTLPTIWTFAPKPSDGESKTDSGIAYATSSTSSGSFGLPTYMPRLVQPPGGMPAAPSNATLVQLGFNFGLNFPFVVGEPDSASQIFAYLPQGIAYGLGVSEHNVIMNALMPYDTSHSLNYITTLAQAYVPSEMVTQMQLDLHTSTSAMYTNPDSAVKTLMNMINPTIPILPGASMDGAPASSAYNPAATASGPAGEGAPIGGDSGSSNKVRGTSVGIGVGACAGAAVYAAAMVYVARRYRQKKKGHQRASSVNTAPEMSQTPSGGMGGLFMSGANGRGSNRGSATGSGGRGSRNSAGSSNGRSVREQGISAPVMSENSLGWN